MISATGISQPIPSFLDGLIPKFPMKRIARRGSYHPVSTAMRAELSSGAGDRFGRSRPAGVNHPTVAVVDVVHSIFTQLRGEFDGSC
ncbi:MAG: hypothetical protein WAN65_22770 [Candidatus Sulfotelmatobacter sp.]